MATFTDTFQKWTDFPKGLHVLVVDSDAQFLREIICKLQSYHYFVTSFCSGEDACTALASRTQTFHVALIEGTESNGVDSCKILSFAKDVPTIVMSVMENMPMMVKSIALGAVEFLLKPPSEDKLKNIWQHVVRKALDSSRDSLRPGYLEPGKPTSSLSEDHEKSNGECIGASRSLILSAIASERFTEPSTPQLEQGARLPLQDATLHESPRSHDSSEVCNYKERVKLRHDTDNLSCFTMSVYVKEEAKDEPAIFPENVTVKEEDGAVDEQAEIFFYSTPTIESAQPFKDADTTQTSDTKVFDSEITRQDERLVLKDEKCDPRATTEVCEMSSTEGNELQDATRSTSSLSNSSKDSAEGRNTDSTCQSGSFLTQYRDKNGSKDEGKRKPNNSENERKDSKSSKKKLKVDWTADLHRRFVQAVEYLGVEQAIPSRILEVMKVDGLTRHNVASHLQKYRSHKKHVFAREAEASNWHQNKLSYGRPWSCTGQTGNQMWIQPRPTVFCQPLHVWGHPKVDSPAMHVMPQYMTCSNGWQSFDNTTWRHPMAESWVPGVPSMGPYYPPHMNFFTAPGYPQRDCSSTNVPRGSLLEDTENNSTGAFNGSCKSQLEDLYPPKALLDAAISEALSNPWTPLPLGLKPPSMESVMAELQRQGINTLSSLS